MVKALSAVTDLGAHLDFEAMEDAGVDVGGWEDLPRDEWLALYRGRLAKLLALYAAAAAAGDYVLIAKG